MRVEPRLFVVSFEKHVRGLINLVYANLKRKMTLTDYIKKFWELFESGSSLDYSGCSEKVSKEARKVQR